MGSKRRSTDRTQRVSRRTLKVSLRSTGKTLQSTALKRIDGRTFEAQGKVGGKPTVTTRVVVSADGKTMTATQTGQDIKGQAIKNVIVLDRQ